MVSDYVIVIMFHEQLEHGEDNYNLQRIEQALSRWAGV